MKKSILSLLSSALIFSLIGSTHATDNDIKRRDAFIFFANYYASEVPESFQYIDLNFKGVAQNSDLEDALQILVYLDLLNNSHADINAQAKLDIYTFEKLSEKVINIKVGSNLTVEEKMSLYTTYSDLENIAGVLKKRKENQAAQKSRTNVRTDSANDLGVKGEILFDVFKTLKKSHYDKDDISNNSLVEGAIKGMTESLGDKYTTYFPPVESDDFFEGLEGEFEGIGAYVDMPTPGELIIVSPIVGSPAEKAGLKGGDRVTHVDGKEITSENSLREVITWIKGPAGTTVTLTIERENSSDALEIPVTRAKITLKDVEFEKLNAKTFYIQIKNFGNNADVEFKQALTELKESSGVNKVIFDLRNNPGGYLGEVSNMLSYAVPKGEATAIVSDGDDDLEYKSLGLELLDFSKYKLVFLQNSGTASASEIMIGTMKDYYPESIIIGEQSFGKGSVQSLKSYKDGSTLKYTSAKWFTGKNRNGIDGVGITPDIDLEFDAERWKTLDKDNQLEEALGQ